MAVCGVCKGSGRLLEATCPLCDGELEFFDDDVRSQQSLANGSSSLHRALSSDDLRNTSIVLNEILKTGSLDPNRRGTAKKVASLVALARRASFSNSGGLPTTPKNGLKYNSTSLPMKAPRLEARSRANSQSSMSYKEEELKPLEEKLKRCQQRELQLTQRGADVSAQELEVFSNHLVALSSEAFQLACERVPGAMEIFDEINVTLENVAGLMESTHEFSSSLSLLSPRRKSSDNPPDKFHEFIAVVKGCFEGVYAALGTFISDRIDSKQEPT